MLGHGPGALVDRGGELADRAFTTSATCCVEGDQQPDAGGVGEDPEDLHREFDAVRELVCLVIRIHTCILTHTAEGVGATPGSTATFCLEARPS